MILLYSFLLLFLGFLKMLIDRRATGLERKYVRTTGEADALVREPVFRGGNSSRPDLGQSAKRQYLLGQLVQKRDRLETAYEAWQQRSEKFGRLVSRLRHWKGRKLPYTLGVVDVWFLLSLVDYLGVGEYVNWHRLAQVVTSVFTR